MENAISVSGLKKYFKDVKAVDNISFQVERGELFGFLGVNGAGKSTTINMMCTLFCPTEGELEICGYRVGTQDEEIRKRIGVVWQNNCLDEKMTVKENLYVRGAMYQREKGGQKRSLRSEAEYVREKLQLQDIWDRRYEKLSGGQKRRCEIAAAFLNQPEVLFLDEPTTGLDPATRKMVWESIDALRKEHHTTVFLTTHYMEEAARADHIAIMDAGKIKEQGTPFTLKEKYTKDFVRLVPIEGRQQEFEAQLLAVCGTDTSLKQDGGAYVLKVSDSMEALPLLKNVEPFLKGFEVINGTMDDAFLNITGKTLADAKGGE